MLWLVYSILVVVLAGGVRIIHKHVLKTEDPFAYAFLQNVLVACALAPFVVTSWQMPTGWWPWILVLVSSALWNGIMLLVFRSYKHSPVSLREPLKQTEILLVFAFSAIFLQETITLFKLLGAALMIGGGLLLTYHREKLFGRLRDPGVQLTIGSVLLAAIVTLIDKQASTYFSALQYTFLLFAVPGLLMAPWARNRTGAMMKALRSKPLPIAAMVVFSGGAYFFMISAFQSGELSIVYPIMKLSLLVAVGGSMLIYHDEREQPLRKLLAACLMILGATLVSGAIA